MFRKKEKQNSILRAKSDPFSFQSPKKEEVDFAAKMERIAFKKQPQRLLKPKPFACNGLSFNSPRKRYAPEHERTPTNKVQFTIIDKVQREDGNVHHTKLKKILLEERANLRKQQRFLMHQQQKIDHENACLRQQIRQLQKNMREMQQSRTSTLINPLEKYLQMRNCLEEAETSSSDNFFSM